MPGAAEMALLGNASATIIHALIRRGLLQVRRRSHARTASPGRPRKDNNFREWWWRRKRRNVQKHLYPLYSAGEVVPPLKFRIHTTFNKLSREKTASRRSNR